MGANVVVKVNVEKLTKFGYADSDGYVSYSKNLTDHDKSLVVPGASFEAEIYTAPSGSRYLNKIVARAGHVEAPKAVESQAAAASVDTERAKKFTPKFNKPAAVDNSMSKDEWAAKDTRISRQGVIQAAVIALAPVVSLEMLPAAAKKLASEMLEFVKGV